MSTEKRDYTAEEVIELIEAHSDWDWKIEYLNWESAPDNARFAELQWDDYREFSEDGRFDLEDLINEIECFSDEDVESLVTSTGGDVEDPGIGHCHIWGQQVSWDEHADDPEYTYPRQTFTRHGRYTHEDHISEVIDCQQPTYEVTVEVAAWDYEQDAWGYCGLDMRACEQTFASREDAEDYCVTEERECRVEFENNCPTASGYDEDGNEVEYKNEYKFTWTITRQANGNPNYEEA